MVEKIEMAGYVSGTIGRITELHALYYFENWDFGKFFEAKVAAELAAFLNRFDERRDGLWTVCLDRQVEGSIAIDGISLTIVSVLDNEFNVYIIPETRMRTTLSMRVPGDEVNVEFDILAKYVDRMIGSKNGAEQKGDVHLKNKLISEGFL